MGWRTGFEMGAVEFTVMGTVVLKRLTSVAG